MAMFDNEIGPLSVDELVQMPENRWGYLRDKITEKRHGGEGIEAVCLKCGHAVFIKASFCNGRRVPLFAHYKGGDPNCEWYHGRTNNPNALRAEQYNGQQPSLAHELMCKKLGEVVQLDSRYVTHRVEEYLRPLVKKNGRYPDVYAEWEGFGPFAIEFQMSHTFQTEISSRGLFYDAEGIPLIWVLYGLECGKDIPQNFNDVIRQHRGNAFVFDSAASQASFAQRTLVLSCFLKTPSGDLESPQLVRLDQLTMPPNKRPYLEDRVVHQLRDEINSRRKPWFDAFNAWKIKEQYRPNVEQAVSSLPFEMPQESGILIAAAFSIVAKASGSPINYASGHNNIKAMLNTYLQSNNGRLAPFVSILTELIQRTSARGLLAGSVKKHFDSISCPQATKDSSEWKALTYLIPEALDPIIREELTYFTALPDWVAPAQGSQKNPADISPR